MSVALRHKRDGVKNQLGKCSRATVVEGLSTNVRELRTATGVTGLCSLPRAAKALIDECGLNLQTRWRGNALKREKFQFLVVVRGSETSVLKFPSNLTIVLYLDCKTVVFGRREAP